MTKLTDKNLNKFDDFAKKVAAFYPKLHLINLKRQNERRAC